jgi:putative oxidoreductase
MDTAANVSGTGSGKGRVVLSWVVRLLAVAIFGMAAMAKFTGDPTNVAIFDTIGVGSIGMYATGALEAIAIVLLLIPRTAFFGGLLGIGLMAGAIVSHLVFIGIDLGKAVGPEDVDISVFVMALVVLAACSVTVFLHKGGNRKPSF